MMPSINLIESIDLAESRFDASKRVLKNVRLIKAGKSLNKRYYSEALLQKSVSLFESTKAFDGHVKGERRVGELTGYYKNVRYENGALRADRHFTDTTAGRDVMAVVEAMLNGAPRSLAGLSINAQGTGKMGVMLGEDVLIVESILSAASVDDVLLPAGGGSYLEAVNPAHLSEAEINQVDAQARQQAHINRQAVVDMLTDGEKLTPAGEKLVAWLAQHAPYEANNPKGMAYEAMRHYLSNVIGEKTFTSAAYLAKFNDYAPRLWSAYQAALDSRLQPAESVKPSPAVRQFRQLQEANEMRAYLDRFASFLTRVAPLIVSHKTVQPSIKLAATHFLGKIGEGFTPIHYMKAYPSQVEILEKVFQDYCAELEEHQ